MLCTLLVDNLIYYFMHIKKILYFLLIIIFWCFSIRLVYADTSDSSSSPLLHSVALGLHESNIIDMYDLDTLVNTDGHRRIKGEADSLVVVPGDMVDLLYFYKSIEDILLEKVRFSASRNTPSLGNFSNLLNIGNLSSEIINTKWGSVDLYKEGFGKEYILNKNILAGEKGKLILGTYEVVKPIQIVSWRLIPNPEMQEINVNVVVKNVTEEYLHSVKYEHCGYLLVKDFLPKEEYTYSYEIDKVLEDGEDFELDSIYISDPNTKTECSVYGSRYYQYFLSDAVPVYSYFEGGWFSGAYVQPEGESFCIQRLPYSYVSEGIEYIYPEAVDNSVDKEAMPMEESVLGIQQKVLNKIKELPKTYISNGKTILLLLVVDIYLWYSFLKKRRNYENKNKDTRICSKSSKDARKGRF